jgi:putative component of membrane protein insertase Oxa1/YidC/SpoIIIJ protein YidD
MFDALLMHVCSFNFSHSLLMLDELAKKYVMFSRLFGLLKISKCTSFADLGQRMQVTANF